MDLKRGKEMEFAYCKGNATIKLMVLTTLIIVLVALLLPSPDQAIRIRVEQGLHQADLAKSALTATCQRGNRKTVSNNAEAGFYFVESIYVADIKMNADCTTGAMDIRIRMQNTGAEEDPEIQLSNGLGQPAGGALDPDAGQAQWNCGLVRGEAEHVPEQCRAALKLS